MHAIIDDLCTCKDEPLFLTGTKVINYCVSAGGMPGYEATTDVCVVVYLCYDFYTFVLVSKEHRYGVLIHIYMHYKSICPAMLLIAMYMYMCIYTCMYVCIYRCIYA